MTKCCLPTVQCCRRFLSRGEVDVDANVDDAAEVVEGAVVGLVEIEVVEDDKTTT